MRTTGFSVLIVSLTASMISCSGIEPAPAQSDVAAMKRDYRRPPPLPVPNPALVELGRDLFFDPQLSASGKTACANCHFAGSRLGRHRRAQPLAIPARRPRANRSR